MEYDISSKEAVYKSREHNNDLMKKLRQELKLGKHKTDLERIKSALNRWKTGKISMTKTMKFIRYVMTDKWFEGLSHKYR